MLFHDSLDFALSLSSWSMIATGILTFVVCLFIPAPYGRYSTAKGWGPLLDARFCWVLMESPNLWMPIVVYILVPREDQVIMTLPSCLLLFMYCLHYVNRAIVYPLRMGTDSSPMPVSVMLLAFSYCCWNGFTQSVSLLVVTSYP